MPSPKSNGAITIVVASKNPVKIQATLLAFQKILAAANFKIAGLPTSSNVSNQPMSEKETLQGALNRVNNLQKAVEADFYVGIEGGLEETEHGMETFAWIVIKSKDGKVGKGRTGSFFIPPKVVNLVQQGFELGDADDIVFGRSNSKQSNGSVGILTRDVVTRTTYYEHAVILALIPFINSDLY